MKRLATAVACAIILSGCITSPLSSPHYRTTYHVGVDSHVYACKQVTSNFENFFSGAIDASCLGNSALLRVEDRGLAVPAGTPFRVIRILNHRNIDAFPMTALIELHVDARPRVYVDWEHRARFVREFMPPS